MSETVQDRQLLIVILLCFLVGLVGTVVELNSGTVFDAETGQPLDDVYVVGKWQGDQFQLIRSHTRCLSVRATKTDGLGRYTLFATSLDLNPFVSDRYRTIQFYRPGYEILQRPAQFAPWSTGLKPDHRTGQERIEHIVGRSAAMFCGQESTADSGIDFFVAVHDEAKSLARTADETRLADSALVPIEMLKYGANEAADRQIERDRKNTIFIHGNK